jgi:hypothetical protein
MAEHGITNLRVATTRSQDLQPLAAAGQTTIEAWHPLHALLKRELSLAHAALLAEPVVNQASGEVDWYAEGDGPAVLLQDLPEPARMATQARLDGLLADIRQFAARLATSRMDSDRYLSDILALALRLPGQDSIYVRGDQPVLVGWGHLRSDGRSDAVILTGLAAPRRVVPPAILPPLPSPWSQRPRPRTWLWGVLGAALLAPLLALLLLVQDPFGWFALGVPQCRLEPGQLGLAQSMQEAVARESVLRAELVTLTTEAGRRRLMCPPGGTGSASGDQGRAQRQGALGGKLQIILGWDDRNDLDLRVVCPDGVDIDFEHRQACGGTLDVDANGERGTTLTSSPVENVYFIDPPPGNYRIIVDPYGMRERDASPFRVTIRRDGQPDQVVTGTAQDGHRNQMVSEFTVAQP